MWSKEPTHAALVSLDQWTEAQDRLATTEQAERRRPKEGRHYLLAGMIRCGTCQRRMEGCWNHGRPYYRCQLGRDSPIDRSEHPRTIYVREDKLLGGLDDWLVKLFDPDHLDETCDALAGATETDPEEQSRRDEIRRRIADLDKELDGYRTVMRNEPDAAATVGKWIAETTVERRRLEALLRAQPTNRLSRDDIRALVESLREITATLQAADPDDKAAVYAEMGTSVTYYRDRRARVEARPRVVGSSVGGGT